MKYRMPGTPLLRVVTVVAAAAGVTALRWWRRPNWGAVLLAFVAHQFRDLGCVHRSRRHTALCAGD